MIIINMSPEEYFFLLICGLIIAIISVFYINKNNGHERVKNNC